MDDALPVRSLECVGDLRRDCQGLVGRQRAFGDTFLERWTFDELEHERDRVIAALEPIYLSDVRMIERSQHLGLTLEPREAVLVIGERRRKRLDCNVALEVRIGGPIYLAHAAGADGFGDFIGTETCAGVQCHRYLIPVLSRRTSIAVL